MSTICIDTQKCRQDGICVDVCPTNFLKGGIGSVPQPREGRGMCISCGQCVAFCPHDAVSITRFAGVKKETFDKKKMPSAEAVTTLCKTRRSIRVFKKDTVEKTLVESLITTASYAPTGKNQRCLRQIVIHDAKRLHTFADLLVQCLENDLATEGRPVLQESLSLIRGYKAGKDPIFRHAPHLLLTVAPKSWPWRAVDSAIFLTYFEIAAHGHGLGACWAGYICKAALAFAELREFLGVDDEEEVCGGQLFGFSKYKVQALPTRIPYSTNWL